MVATRGFLRAVAAVAVAASALASILVANVDDFSASAATPAASVAGGPVSPTVSPTGSVTVSVTITNTSNTALPAGTLSVTPSSGALLTNDELNTWLGGKGYNAYVIGEVKVSGIAPRAMTAVSITFPAQSLPQPSVWGVRGLLATYSIAQKTISSTRSTVVLLASDAPAAVRLATVLPLVGPPSALGLMTSAEITAATAANGYLTQKLSAVAGSPVTLAVDPRITTSIVALGSAAPPRAAAWLRNLNTASQTGFWLTYGDSDTSGLIQAGSNTPLSPGIDDVANIPLPPAGANWGGSSWPGWAPTLENISWPIANTLSSAVVAKIAGWGNTRIIASSDNINGEIPATSLGRSGLAKVITVNAAASACAQALEVSNSTASRASATACLAARVAVAATSSRSGSTVVVALTRSSEHFSVGGFGATIEALKNLRFAQATTLDQVVSGASSPINIAARTESANRRNALKRALVNQNRITGFAPVAADPSVVINPGQRRLAAISSSEWIGTPDWNQALVANGDLTNEVLGSVSIVTSSTINMVSGQARIPVVIRNDLTSAVSVTVHAVPSNARISVGGEVPLTIEANSQARAYIPVTARVGNGGVTLEVSLTDSRGNSVGRIASLPVNVRADWETFGLWGLGIVFFGLVIAGVIRTVRRSKRKADAQ